MVQSVPSTHIEPVTASAGRLRVIAVLLIGLQAIALGIMSNGWIYPILAIIISIFALRSDRKTSIDPRYAFRLVSLGIVLFIARYLVAPPQFPRGVLAVRTPLFHLVAQALVAYQITIVYFNPRHIRLPQKLPWMGILSMLCAANVMVSPAQRWMFQTLVVIFILLLVGWTGMARPFVRQQRTIQNGRTIAVGICMVLTAILTWGSATLLNRYENDLDDLISQFIQQNESAAETGFSGDGRLQSVTRMHSSNENTVALRIESESPPDYMRGSAFLTYASRNWLAPSPREHPRRLTPLDVPPDTAIDTSRGSVFALRGTSAEQLSQMSRLECWPNPAGDGAIFSTVDSEFIQFNVEQTAIDTADVVQEEMLPIGYPYRLFRGQPKVILPLPPTTKSQLTTAIVMSSPDVVQQISELAKTVFADCTSDADQIAAVQQYFATYTYSESTQVPAHRDPIEWFLLDKPAAHCEFFASAAVALLRQAKIPSRYVTGFMVTEQNLYGNYWVARNRDAHAWAEAWLPEQGWVVVETTPGDGIPQQSAPSTARQLMEYLQSTLQRFRVQLSVGGIRWLGSALLAFLLAPMTLVVSGLLFTLLWLRRKSHQRAAAVKIEQPNPQVVKLNRLLTQMDQRMAKVNLERWSHETLNQFAARIESTTILPSAPPEQANHWAQWYRQYAELRYGDLLNDDLIATLEAKTSI